MHCCGGVFLLLCVSTLCIKDTAGYYNYGHSLFTHGNIASKGLPQPHSIHKRQIEIDLERRCKASISEEQCNNGFVQESIDFMLQCNLRQEAEGFVAGCQRNSNGDYCSIAETYFDDIIELGESCAESVENCATECRASLMRLREELGCCLNLMYNTSNFGPLLLNNPNPLTSALWSRCGVEPITEECTPSTVELPDSETGDLSLCSVERGVSISCEKRFLQPLVDELTGECIPYAQEALEMCGVDESGQPCYERASELITESTTALFNCANTNTSMCSQTCVDTLDNVASSFGCCFNNIYNGTTARIINNMPLNWLSKEYWSQCNIDSPGFCETRFTVDGSISSKPSRMIILGLVALLVLHCYNQLL